MVLLHILRDADDLNLYLDLATASETEMHADGIPAGEESLDHRFACDCDFGTVRAVGIGKFTAGQQRYSKG